MADSTESSASNSTESSASNKVLASTEAQDWAVWDGILSTVCEPSAGSESTPPLASPATAPDQRLRAPATPVESTRRRGLKSLLAVSIAVATAVGAFAVVRAWFIPVGAAGVAPATLSVHTQPAGAELLIDQQSRGRTPATLSIGPGAHVLTVRGAGIERTVKLTFAAGAEVAQHFDLTPPPAPSPGRLSIVTDPPGARVTVDGTLRGLSPLVIDDLPAAEHVVAVASESGSARRTIAVADGITKEVVFSMPRATAPVTGWIAVISPFPVELVENGEAVATSGTAKIMAAPGRHDVLVRNKSLGYELKHTVEVVPGGVVSVTVNPPDGLLNVNASPWADISIDGAAVGQTPLANIRVPIGTHQITFRHPQFGERTERIVVTTNGINRVAVDLRK